MINSRGIGENIARLRQAKNITQQDLAKKVGISVGYLSKIEEGSSNPGAKTLSRIAYALKVTLYKLSKYY